MARPSALHAAISLFTIVRVPPVELDRATAARAMGAFPWVGLLVGAAAAAASWLVSGGGSGLSAVVGLGVIAGLTGALHLDGVADTADGLGSRKPAAEALVLMKKSDIGPMGVAALVFVLLLDAAALASPRLVGLGLPAALAALPMVGRLAAVAGTLRGVPCARPGGFGSLFAGVTSARTLALDAAAVLAVTAGLGAASGLGASGLGAAASGRGAAVFALAALGSWLVATLWQRHLLRRLGGLTGDTFGSLIEVTQTAFLIAVAVAL